MRAKQSYLLPIILGLCSRSAAWRLPRSLASRPRAQNAAARVAPLRAFGRLRRGSDDLDDSDEWDGDDAWGADEEPPAWGESDDAVSWTSDDAPAAAAGWSEGDAGAWDDPEPAAPEEDATERSMDLFMSALDDADRDVLSRELDDGAPRVVGLDGRPIDDDESGKLDALAAAPVDDEDDGDDRDEGAEAALDLLAEAELEQLEEAGVVEDERIGVVPSHELIDVDADGDPQTDAQRLVFVDEATCIGCTMCAGIAPLTFMMEDAYGRARSFNQEGDDDETIAEAIATCPVDCIHYVPWDELVRLERERDGVMDNYNFKGRLVGNEGLLSTAGAGASLLEISTNTMSRCTNCPTNKCPECPMFAVSNGKRKKRCGNCPENGCANCPIAIQYPEFQKRRARRDRKRKERIRAKQAEAAENLGLAGEDGGREL